MEKRRRAGENIRHLAHARGPGSLAYSGYDMFVCLVGRLPFAPLWEANGSKERTNGSSDLLRDIGSGARGEPGGFSERPPYRWRGEEGGELA